MKLNVTDWNIIPYADAWTRQTEWFDALIRAKQAGEEYENHWVLKPQNGILWQRTFFEWLDKWLK